ncbi:unnamed protein product [Pseudo-nitzschia multistriata]|uniref:N-acetyltransferase domain-containing protein n=1 Tax=Pseudo-nitzschia multistriata TaxID=183589 RepID=A0A448Z9H2_9STRA|nr:unnamed protein product [Pseudo-nitzschia multistriata]
MEANPELTSRDDALRFLTPTFDDFGKGKVYYGDGTIGESLQFFALGDDKSSLVSLEKNNEEHVHDLLLQNRRVIASIEAVKEPIEEKELEIRVSIELKNLSVHEDSRRRGIGKALTKAVQDYARSEVLVLKEQKNKKVEGLVHLLVEAKNAGAVRLYEESGFRRIGIGKDPLCKMTWSIDES